MQNEKSRQQFGRFIFTILLGSVWLGGVARAQQETDNKEGLEIANLLTSQKQAWNEGDLEKFMGTYWKSDKLTFSSGGKTTYGWKATLENYRENYAPPQDMGKLNFDHLEIMKIESNSALVLGQWHLEMKDQSKRDGNFSLVMKKMDDGWKIIHDHSSKVEPKTKADHPETKK